MFDMTVSGSAGGPAAAAFSANNARASKGGEFIKEFSKAADKLREVKTTSERPTGKKSGRDTATDDVIAQSAAAVQQQPQEVKEAAPDDMEVTGEVIGQDNTNVLDLVGEILTAHEDDEALKNILENIPAPENEGDAESFIKNLMNEISVELTKAGETAVSGEISADGEALADVMTKLKEISEVLPAEEPAADVTETGDTSEPDVIRTAVTGSESAVPGEPGEDAPGGGEENLSGDGMLKPKAETKPADERRDGAFHVSRGERQAETAKPSEVQEAPRVRAADIIEKIVQKAAVSHQNGVSEIEIDLRGDSLGKMSLLLTATENGMTAKIKAESHGMAGLLAQNIAELEQSLKANGIDMRSIEIEQSEISWDFGRGRPDQDRDGGESSAERNLRNLFRVATKEERITIRMPAGIYAGTRGFVNSPQGMGGEGFDYMA